MRRYTWLAILSLPFSTWVIVSGCGGDSATAIDGGLDGTLPDSGDVDGMNQPDTNMPPDDAPSDGTMSDSSGNDAGGLVYRCGDAGVTDCSQCANRPRPCVNCFIDGGALFAECVTLGTSCFPGNNSPLQRCPCVDAGSCPVPYQVCHNVGQGLACRTCGEANTLGDTCKGGGMCRADGGCN